MEEDKTNQFVSSKLSACLSLAQDLVSLLQSSYQSRDILDTINIREYLASVEDIVEQLEEGCQLKSAFIGKFSPSTLGLFEKTHENLRELMAKFTNLKDTNRLIRAIGSLHFRKNLDEELVALQRNLAAAMRHLRRCKDVAFLELQQQQAQPNIKTSSQHASLPIPTTRPFVRFAECRRNTASGGLMSSRSHASKEKEAPPPLPSTSPGSPPQTTWVIAKKPISASDPTKRSRSVSLRAHGSPTPSSPSRETPQQAHSPPNVQSQPSFDSEAEYGTITSMLATSPRKPSQPSRSILSEMPSNLTAKPKGFWDQEFGEVFFVDWEIFEDALAAFLERKLSQNDTKILKHILDSSDTGGVTASRFLQFESAFGPLQRCLTNLKNLLKKKWFHGFLTRAEVTRLLEGEKPGTFLVRFSGSSPGCFALSTVNAEGGTDNILIEADPPHGVCAGVGEQGAIKPHFDSVCEFVETSNICKHPFMCDFLKESWFHGDVNKEEAEELLRNEPIGTFLIRFSQKSLCFASSYVRANNTVRHSLIRKLEDGRFEHVGEYFPSLKDVVMAYNRVLKVPFKNTRSETYILGNLEDDGAEKSSFHPPRRSTSTRNLENFTQDNSYGFLQQTPAASPSPVPRPSIPSGRQATVAPPPAAASPLGNSSVLYGSGIYQGGRSLLDALDYSDDDEDLFDLDISDRNLSTSTSKSFGSLPIYSSDENLLNDLGIEAQPQDIYGTTTTPTTYTTHQHETTTTNTKPLPKGGSISRSYGSLPLPSGRTAITPAIYEQPVTYSNLMVNGAVLSNSQINRRQQRSVTMLERPVSKQPIEKDLLPPQQQRKAVQDDVLLDSFGSALIDLDSLSSGLNDFDWSQAVTPAPLPSRPPPPTTPSPSPSSSSHSPSPSSSSSFSSVVSPRKGLVHLPSSPPKTPLPPTPTTAYVPPQSQQQPSDEGAVYATFTNLVKREGY